MSEITATVTKIKTQDSLNLVSFDLAGVELKMMSLELSGNIKIGSKVKLSLKPTAVAVGKDVRGILSYSNKLSVKVKKIKRGKLLTSLMLEHNGTTLESIITKDSFLRLQTHEGDTLSAFVKASELSIKEVYYD